MKLILLFVLSSFLLSCEDISLNDVEDAIAGNSDGLKSNEHRIFVSSTTYNGNLGGLAGADAKCNTLAQAQGLTRNYKAMLSSSSEDLKDRIVINGAIYNFDSSGERKVVEDDESWGNGYLGVIDANLLNSVTFTEDLSSITGYMWTGSGDDGTQDGGHCADWTSGTIHSGSVGIIEELASEFIQEDEHNCNELKHILCISQ